MPNPRYQPLRVDLRGYPIAVIKDTRTGEELAIRRKGNSFLHWDRRDRLVDDASLRRVAREALKGAGVS
jgi:hypothetical protein